MVLEVSHSHSDWSGYASLYTNTAKVYFLCPQDGSPLPDPREPRDPLEICLHRLADRVFYCTTHSTWSVMCSVLVREREDTKQNTKWCAIEYPFTLTTILSVAFGVLVYCHCCMLTAANHYERCNITRKSHSQYLPNWTPYARLVSTPPNKTSQKKFEFHQTFLRF